MTDAAPRAIATSDVADLLGADGQSAPMRWQRYGGRGAFHGSVATVLCTGSAGLVRQCINEPGHGRVLVVSTESQLSTAVLGDRMAATALRNGWAGMLIHGAVRDADALRQMDIGVFALCATPQRGSFEVEGERDVAVTLDALEIGPGDYIFCDGDGIVVCNPAAAYSILGSDQRYADGG